MTARQPLDAWARIEPTDRENVIPSGDFLGREIGADQRGGGPRAQI